MTKLLELKESRKKSIMLIEINNILSWVFCFVFGVWRLETWAWHALGKGSMVELQTQLFLFIF